MDFDKNNFYEDGVARVLSLIRNTFGDYFKGYFDAELLNIPEESLPCVMVTETTGTVSSGATTQDDITENITIIVALNIKDDLGAGENTNLTGFKVRKLVKGQMPGTGFAPEWQPKSIMGVLRQYITLEESASDTEITTEFGPNVRGKNIATEEGHVSLQIKRSASVIVRQ